MLFVFVIAILSNYSGWGCRRYKMLGIIRILLMTSIPFLAIAQINTALISPIHLKIKILTVTENVISEDNYTKPDIGNKFFSVKVQFDYFGCKSKIYPSFFDLKLKDLDGNFYEPSIKTFVVKKPYLFITNAKTNEKISGWVTYEIPQNVAINSLQIKYEQTIQLCSDWIPLWPIISNSECAKKITKQVSREKNNSFIKIKQLVLKKTLLSINNYLDYTKTKHPTYFVKGLENASHAKLLIHSFKNRQTGSTEKTKPIFKNIIAYLCQDTPKNFLKQQREENDQNTCINLKKLRKYVIKNYLQN